MAPLTSDRSTECTYASGIPGGIPIAAGATIYAGSIVLADAAGRAVAGSDVASRTFVGIAKKAYVSTGAGSFQVETTYPEMAYLANSALNPCTDALRGSVCYVEDDQTVAILTTNWIPIGTIGDVDASGVWVRLATPEQLLTGVAGAFSIGTSATVGTTLGVTGIATFGTDVHVASKVDTTGAAVLRVGDANATAVNIADTGITTTIEGPAVCSEGCSVTTGKLKAVGVLATDGLEAGYSTANTGAPPTIVELTTAFGAPAAGRNGFVGVIFDIGGVGYLVAIAGGVYYAVPMVAAA